MKKLLLTSFSFLLAFVGFSQQYNFTEEEKAWMKEHPVVNFGYDPNWEPYEIYRDGEYTGIIGEFVEKIEAATGIDMVPIKGISWAESIRGLKDGSVHMVPNCAISEDRKKFLLFTESFISDPLIIATRRKFEFIGSLESLYGKRVAVPKDYWTYDLVRKEHPEIQLVVYNNIKQCLEALSFEKVDAVIGTLGVVSYHINNKGFTNLKVAAPAPYSDLGLAMAFTQDWSTFRNICQKVIATVSIQERNRIQKDWISIRYEYSFSWSEALAWLLLAILLILIGFALFYMWNRSLQLQIEKRIRIQANLKTSLNEVKKSNQEKQILLQEIHHRIKNNLQIITSLIRLQSKTAENKEVERSLNEAIERIRAIALIHEKIYETSSVNYISAKEYIEALANDIVNSFSIDKNVTFIINVEAKNIDLKAIVPLALILNELITNSFKYAFTNMEEGVITIHLEENKDILELYYHDNGQWIKNESNKSFGTSLISIFTEQLEGRYELVKAENGTKYNFAFLSYS